MRYKEIVEQDYSMQAQVSRRNDTQIARALKRLPGD